MKVSRTLLAVVIVALAGCASQPAEVEPAVTETTVNGSLDETWGKLEEFASTKRIAVLSSDKDSGVMKIKVPNLGEEAIDRYCDASDVVPMLRELIGGEIEGTVTLAGQGTSTAASLDLVFAATSRYCWASCNFQTHRCTSKGEFEREIFGAIR